MIFGTRKNNVMSRFGEDEVCVTILCFLEHWTRFASLDGRNSPPAKSPLVSVIASTRKPLIFLSLEFTITEKDQRDNEKYMFMLEHSNEFDPPPPPQKGGK